MPLDHNESLVALQMVNQIDEAIIWLHLWHLESKWDRLIQNALRERLSNVEVKIVGGPSAIHLELGELTVDLLKLAFIVVEPSLL